MTQIIQILMIVFDLKNNAKSDDSNHPIMDVIKMVKT